MKESMSIEEKRRAAFEAAYPTPKGVRWDAEYGQYHGDWPADQRYFEKLKVWNAALDSIVVELPPAMDVTGLGEDFAYEAKACREAIEAAGLTVTP